MFQLGNERKRLEHGGPRSDHDERVSAGSTPLGRIGRGAWFRLGVAEVHLTEDDSPGPLSKRHFAIEVEDLAAARTDVTAFGASIEKEMSWRFWTRDPAMRNL